MPKLKHNPIEKEVYHALALHANTKCPFDSVFGTHTLLFQKLLLSSQYKTSGRQITGHTHLNAVRSIERLSNKLNCPHGLAPGKPQEPEKDEQKAFHSLNTGTLGDNAE